MAAREIGGNRSGKLDLLFSGLWATTFDLFVNLKTGPERPPSVLQRADRVPGSRRRLRLGCVTSGALPRSARYAPGRTIDLA